MSSDGAVRAIHVHSGNLYGGVERVLEALAHAPRGGRVDSSFAICFDGRLRRELAAAGADLHCLGTVRLRRPDQVARARGRLRSVVERLRPDVAIVHSSWAQAIFGPVVAAAGVPLARWMHAPDPGPAWLEWWAGRSRPSVVFHNSRYTQSRTTGVTGAATKVVYPPLRASAASAGARAEVRSALGVAEDVAVIAIAARLEPWKGHRLLLEAFAGMPANGELWVIGGVQRPSERAYLDALVLDAARRGIAERVRFLGEREDVARLLAAADVYCQPNTAPEPFGISFVEALAAGIPVVTTRLGAAPEIVDDSCGRLVDPGDIGALTSMLATLVADAGVRQRLGRAGVARAAQFSDLAASTARLAEAIRSVVEPPVLS